MIDSRTPVVVGVGQVSERIEDPDYRRRSPVELAADAVRAALDDCGARPDRVAAAVDTVAGVRQFEISHPNATAALGRSDNFPRSVAARAGADPVRAILEVTGGHAPQHLVTELAGTIAQGGSDIALAFGAEAMSTVAHLVRSPGASDWSESVGGQLEDRGYGLDDFARRYQLIHGLTNAVACYALFENARRARCGLSRAEYDRAEMGELFEPFTRVAATNPHAVAPKVRSATQLITPTERNRIVAEPFPRYVVAREKVNQGAAVLIMSVATATRLGVPEEQWVFLHGHADLRERDLLERADLGSAPAAVLAARQALQMAGVDAADLATVDLYSCFPIAVSVVREGLGLAVAHPRGLTVTGGLPFFGGPGNDYSMHAIAETVHRARAAPGSFGLVGANGGMLSKYSAGIYSTQPTGWRPSRDRATQAEIESWPAPERVVAANGRARIETYTVVHRRDGARTGIVVGRLMDNDRRFLALTAQDDAELLELLGSDEPFGARVRVRSSEEGNRVRLG